MDALYKSTFTLLYFTLLIYVHNYYHILFVNVNVDGDLVLQALKVLRTAEYAPYVVFIAAPTGLLVNNVR